MTTLLSSRATSKSNPTAIASALREQVCPLDMVPTKGMANMALEKRSAKSHTTAAPDERFHKSSMPLAEKESAYSSHANSRAFAH
jgi:hypothetical protein